MSDFSQWAMIAFISLGIVVAIWRGGAANPQGTGKLANQMHAMKSEITGLSTRVGSMEYEVTELKEDSASTKDIERLEEKISTVRAEMAGNRELAERTYTSVERIERMILERGLRGA